MIFSPNAGAATFVPAGYQQVWGDEFSGDKLDATKWTFWAWRQGGRTVHPENVSVHDGAVHFVTTRGIDMKMVDPSAIYSLNKMEYRYGYAEIRIKTKTNDAACPAWWMKSNTDNKDRKDLDGEAEVDAFEACSNDGCGVADTERSTLHKWLRYSDGEPNPGDFHGARSGSSTPVSQTDWITVGVLWTPDKIVTYVNGVEQKNSNFDLNTDIPTAQGPSGMGMFRDPLYMILNGGVTGPVDNFLGGTYDTQVDYVRLYQPTDGSATLYTAPTAEDATLVPAKIGAKYSAKLPIMSNPGDLTYALKSGSLPDGLALDEKTGTITGAPTKSGKFTFAVTAHSDYIPTKDATANYEIDVAAPDVASNPPALTPPATGFRG